MLLLSLLHLVSSLLFSCLLLSCLSSSVFSSLSVPVFFLCLCLSLSLSPCGVVVVLLCVTRFFKKKKRVSTQRVSVCTFKTSPFVPAPRAHVETRVRM